MTTYPQTDSGWFCSRLALKIAAAIVGMAAVIVVVYTHLVLRVKSDWVAQRLEHRFERLGQQLDDQLAAAESAHDPEAIGAFLAAMKDETKLDALRLESGSRVWASSEAEEAGALAASHGGSERTRVPLLRSAACLRCHESAGGALASLVIDYPQELGLAPVRADQRVLLAYGATFLALMSLLCAVIVWWVVQRPLTRLTRAVARIEAGDLTVDCGLKGKDELGRLCQALQRMSHALQEKDSQLRELHESELTRADRLASIGSLASGLAHDIKSPLHSINAALEMLCAGCHAKTGGRHQVVDAIRGQLNRIIGITDDMLHIAKPRAPSLELCELTGILDQTLDLLKHQINQKHLAVETVVDTDDVSFVADPDKLQQVLLNLLLNAIQASYPNGAVRVHVSGNEDQLVLRVQDSGPGIGPELEAQIFEPFYTTKQDGNGLGLAMTRSLIEQHHGTINLVTHDGSGACFEIAIPRQPEEHTMPTVKAEVC